MCIIKDIIIKNHDWFEIVKYLLINRDALKINSSVFQRTFGFERLGIGTVNFMSKRNSDTYLGVKKYFA